MGKAIRVCALVLLLACTARAGWMPNGTPEPPPPSAPQEQETEGQSDTPPLVQIALSLLALF